MALSDVSESAIIEACSRFIKGTVPDQSMKFAPSVAQVRDMATDIQAEIVLAAQRRNAIAAIEKPYKPEDAATRARMGFKMNVLSASLGLGKVDDVAVAQKTGRLEEFIALAQSWGVPVPEEIWSQKDHIWR